MTEPKLLSPDASTSGSAGSLLEVEGLSIEVTGTQSGKMRIVDDVSFSVARGSSVALVGESGSGKTVTALSIMGLSGATGTGVVGGSIRFDGIDIVTASERTKRSIRGARIGMIFQQPTRSLNPAYSVGDQIAESARRHLGLTRKEAWNRAVQMLDRVGIANAAARAREYPHAFSGGMCQRVMIAMAMVCEPELLIADEPTTALDVTVQRKILDLITEIQLETGVSVLFVSHDLAVVAEFCQRVVVMYAGNVVEDGPVDDVFFEPAHPYTSGLLGAIPRPEVDTGGRMLSIPGQLPAVGTVFPGCRFAPRCDFAVEDLCTRAVPPMLHVGAAHEAKHAAKCARVSELTLAGVIS
ncbi:ABC transporter ATP-binding protein [Arthrobacter sp. zg-Y820]|uniref:ABC transporter ATP-binding protein n=1 Tax=unclassified Arthrobacter TaxID=235627 RepID=UPI001E4D517C|nr:MULTISPECIES: ABC transporter ATP-binding protein [unclassified Arthrobacter]MCC9196805.1 ABC transporter ATP-binding protein [Arthrobacter sp. zg-Y820]MDK1279667.1 ABC transporter ATP-binding protein [Arthrobacter sp. zg.Y820]WIB07963.1 ABC transporter ATP-binding protein [Arthrobacter sp. zg-Y820]